MHFPLSRPVNRMPSVLPLLGVSLLGVLPVLVMACFALSREEQSVRLPTSTLPRPPVVRERPAISLRISQQGAVTVGGQTIADDDVAAAWQHECGALRLLGFRPSQATVVVRADPDVPIDRVQRDRKSAGGRLHAMRMRPAESPDAAGTRP